MTTCQPWSWSGDHVVYKQPTHRRVSPSTGEIKRGTDARKEKTENEGRVVRPLSFPLITLLYLILFIYP